MKKLSYSIIVPVFNRPNEIDELLESLTHQDFQEKYEILIVEDGSQESSEEVVKKYKKQLNILLIGPIADLGILEILVCARPRETTLLSLILIIFSSKYLSTINTYLEKHYLDCFGGADTAHESFSNVQKAINYAMTSFLTTGGIRGSKKSIQKFEPRSFNMGISKEAFLVTQGFSRVHPGEDPDVSQRILKAGFTIRFLPGAGGISQTQNLVEKVLWSSKEVWYSATF